MFLFTKRRIPFNSLHSILWLDYLNNYRSSGAIFSTNRYFATRNFYDILNVKKTSDKNEIKQAYRKLALKYHPDRNPNNRKEAEEKFREITEAYETLSDEGKKRSYDSMLNNTSSGDGTSYFYSKNNTGSNTTNHNTNFYNANNMNYNYQTRRMTDEEIENVFKTVFGNFNLKDILKQNMFNETNFTSTGIKNDLFQNIGSFNRTTSNPNIKHTNIKTEIIHKGNKLIERTTKIITYNNGKIEQEIVEKELNNANKGS